MLAESAAESASSASTAEEEYKVDQSAHWCPLFVGFLVVVLLFVLVVRLFPTYRLVLDVPYGSLKAFYELVDRMKGVYGSRLVLSEMDDRVPEKVKQLYFQISFSKFSELCDFYLSPWFKHLVHYYWMDCCVCCKQRDRFQKSITGTPQVHICSMFSRFWPIAIRNQPFSPQYVPQLLRTIQ